LRSAGLVLRHASGTTKQRTFQCKFCGLSPELHCPTINLQI
jgi:hypothetical protein